jgi:tetratricopeptide (TPR) repeat protein
VGECRKSLIISDLRVLGVTGGEVVAVTSLGESAGAITARNYLQAVICPPRIFLLNVMIIAAWGVTEGVGYGHGAYHDVVASLEKRINGGTKEPELRFELACAHQEHGEWALALVELERVERLAPGVHETGLIQGMALATGRHWAAALAVLDDFLEVQPRQVLALRARGRVLREMGCSEAAAKDLKEALEREVKPTGEQVVEFSELLRASGRRLEALTVLEQGRLRVGDEPSLLEALLAVAVELEQWEQVLVAVDGLQKVAPRPEPWMMRRAEVLEAAGQQSEARAAWQKLRDHLLTLPSLERGTGQLAEFWGRARSALGEPFAKPVAALPASAASQTQSLQSVPNLP